MCHRLPAAPHPQLAASAAAAPAPAQSPHLSSQRRSDSAASKHCLSPETRTSARALTTCVHRRRWRESGRGRAPALGLTADGRRATPLPKTRRHPNMLHAMACVDIHTDLACLSASLTTPLSLARTTTLRSRSSLQRHKPQALACRWLLGYFFVQVHVRLAVCIAQQQASTNFMNRAGSEFLCVEQKQRLPVRAGYVASKHSFEA